MKTIIFTDLDGTLLDARTSSFDPARPALHMIEGQNIPLIFCSSKTRAEIEYYREKTGNRHPFVSENGGAVFIPAGYFSFPFPRSFPKDGYEVVELGTQYATLRTALKQVMTENGFRLKGFGDMSVDEVAALTGVSREEAALAKQREYDEPFLIESGEEAAVIKAIRKKGYHVAQARFLHILGRSDKGKAVTFLKGLYRTKLGEIRTIALGDGPNDLPMFEKVDISVIVQKPDGAPDPRVRLQRLRRAEGIGPLGWNSALVELLTA